AWCWLSRPATPTTTSRRASMGRCNCATETCSCDDRGRYGIAIDGAGTANNPRIHRFDPRVDNILDTSPAWAEQQKKLGVRVSGREANQITAATDGICAPGGSGCGVGAGSAQVATLPETSVARGMFGNGYVHVPENLLGTDERAAALSLDMVPVPLPTRR